MAGIRRESKGQFWQRIQQEGRLAQAQAAEADMLRQGLSRRNVQKVLVDRFQPTDGTSTRAWPTPDSWKWGRRFFRKPISAAERYEGDLHWAYNNLGRVKPEEAPDARKRSLLLLAEQKPAEFHRKYQRALPSITERQEAQEEERELRWERVQWERQRPQREEKERKQREAKRKRAWRLKKRQQREAEERAEQERRRQQAEKEKRTAKTLEVLRKRQTRLTYLTATACDERGRCAYKTAEYPVADWPYDVDSAVVSSRKAVSWQAELDAAKKAAQEKARTEATETLAWMTQGAPSKSVTCTFR
jgi:hypothetical protein